MNERLLNSWVGILLAICSERVVSEIPYNESIICNILYRQQCSDPEKRLTATDLCEKTKIQKSQMNRILSGMEEKHLILRERSLDDKRQVLISLDLERAELYKRQHAKILGLADAVIGKFGEDKSEKLIELFDAVASIAKEVIV